MLEATCDHHLWFWHALYGYTGSLNDIKFMNMLHLQTGFLNSRFANIESKSAVLLCIISNKEFCKMIYLVDRIYP